MVQHFSTLSAYCEGIAIPAPKWEDLDVRRFEDNMATVRHSMPPFRHEFYAIALKLQGQGAAQVGAFNTGEHPATVFFNSPYQVLSWDIVPDWTGSYVMFSEAFYHQWFSTMGSSTLTDRFPFLLVDQTIPLSVSPEECDSLHQTLQDIAREFSNVQLNSRAIIAHHLQVLLLKIERLYNSQRPEKTTTHHRQKDLELVSRFRSLLELSFKPNQTYGRKTPHQVQFYADQLHLHPSHLNAVIKRVTRRSASEHIYEHILLRAKSQLTQTTAPIKEIAYGLYYDYPNHFTSFFKSRTQFTPLQYRKQARR